MIRGPSIALLADWSPTLPDTRTTLWLAPLLTVLVLGTFALAGYLRVRRGVRVGYTRKILHFVLFAAAGVLTLTHGFPAVNLLGGIGALTILLALWQGDGNRFYEAMAREKDAPRRTLFIVVPVVATIVGGVACAYLFGAFATVGYLAAGCGDAIAEPVGLRWGRHRYRVPGLAGVSADRSVEGSAAVFVASAISVGALLHLAPSLGALDGAGLHPIVAALAISLAATLAEAFSPHGLDNLTVQIAAAGTAMALLPS